LKNFRKLSLFFPFSVLPSVFYTHAPTHAHKPTSVTTEIHKIIFSSIAFRCTNGFSHYIEEHKLQWKCLGTICWRDYFRWRMLENSGWRIS